MIRTDRRRCPVLFSAIAALALAGAVLKEKGKMNEFANILRTVPGKRTVQFWLVLFLFSLAVISGIAWPTVLQAETGSTLDLASLDVTDPMGTTIDLGTFDPAVLTYSANVASTVERVTVTARPASSSGVYVNLTPGDYGPDDNLWEVEGRNVTLNHGRNLIVIGVYSSWVWVDEPLRVYTIEINRAGSAPEGEENYIRSNSLITAREGSTLPFLLTRSGDVSAALTVPVDVWSVDKTNRIRVAPHIDHVTILDRVEVEFQAGSASVIVNRETTDDSLYTGGYHLGVTLIEGTGYRVPSFNYASGRFASTRVSDNDISKPNLESLSLTDQNGASVAIGEFDPDLTSYSGSVGSEVTHVTVTQSTTEKSRFASKVLPPDSQPNVAGHQVALQHGANLVSVILMAPFHDDAVTSGTYDVIVTRAGSPSGTPTPTVSVYGLGDAKEGYTMPFILARTGDTSQSLTVPVNVSETGGDMVPQASEGSSDVVFPAGSASARVEVPTVADQDWEEHSTVTMAVVDGTGYELSSPSGSASSTVKDNDVPAVTAAFTVDTSQPQEGDVVTASVTVTTDGPKQPHGYVGNLDFSAELGSAQQADLHIPFGSNYRNFPAGHRVTGSHSYGGGDDVKSASFPVNQQAMQPVESDGVITHYQYQFSVPILIVDDERAEADETFDISVEWDSYSRGRIRTMDQGITSRTVTIQEHDDTPSTPDPVSYITVAIADSGTAGSTYTVSWHDTKECVGSRKYEVYLTRLQSDGWTRFSKLGETANTNTQLTVSKDNFPLSGQRNLRVYCGDIGRPVGEVPLPWATENSVERPVPGTYSSQPALTSLTVSPGTLGPAFSNYGFLYSVLDVPYSSSQITLNATARSGYTISWDPSEDADDNTDGHQVDLAEGYNSIFVSADHDLGVNSFTYEVIVKGAGPTVQQEQENSPATGRPAISGTVQVGETLTADTSGIADADGLTNATFSYQWLSSRDTEIGGATSSTYTLQASDASQVVKVRVTFTDDAGNNETLTSAATAAVAAAPTPNSPATGAPTISGTAQVGETLTADTSGISDADGLTNVSFSYQWIRSDGSTDTNIAGQTTSKYTLVSADEGQTIKVRVSFTDDADNQEMLTSAPTAAVAAPAQADSEDEPSELSYLTVVVTEDDSDPDNVVTTFTITWNDAEDCSASYNAYLDGVVGDPIHLGSAASEGEQIAASLTNVGAESIGFDAKLYCGTIGSGRLVDSLMIPEYSRSFDTVPISRAYLPKPGTYSTEPGLTVLTVSSGTLTPAFHSQTLNYTVPDVANADGRITLTTTTKADYYTVAFIPGSLYFYISSCSHGGQQTSVSYQDDTGNPLYPLTDADANTPGFQMELDEGENVFKIRVWPNCESGHVYKLTVTRAANTPATGAPTIGGAAQVGETLTVDTSGIADADGLSGATFSYQWLSSRDTEIQGATDAAYILVPGDASKTIKVRVSFTDDEGNAETLTSAATGAVAPRPNSPATGAPTIGGTAQVGETLTVETSGIADADGLTGATFSYQWLSSRDTEIGGATSSTYTLVAADEGKAIKVRISFTDDADNQEMLTSVATTAVAGAVDSGAPSYITVEVTEDYSDPINIVTNFAITWSDAAVCSVDYNAYLNIKPSTLTGDETEGSQLHLGSAASDGAQITAGLTGVQGGFRGFDVELYCGTDGSGRLVSRVVIPGEYTRPKPGTYSSEPPLSALSVSHGTMTPTFQGGTSRYTVPDVANAETRITITATPKEGNFVKFFEGADSPVIGLIVDAWGLGPRPSGLSEDCSRGFGDYYGPLIEMTDADPDTPGLQVDLYDDRSYVWVHVYPTAVCSLGKSYALTITRAEGEVSLPRPNRPAIGLPVIAPPGRDPGWPGFHLYIASPCVGCTMNAFVSSIKDRDGWDESTFSYQWLADDADITGATSSSYTAADTDLGKTLKVRVSFTDDRGNEETLTSLATRVVRLRNFMPTGKPVILGTPEVGQTLRVDVSGISDPNGMTNATFTYQWVNTPWTDDEYTLADSDEGRRIWVQAAYTDDAGHMHMLESAPTDAVAARPSSPATGVPTITGTAQVGETLTADTSGIADADGLTGATFSYQWLGSRDAEIQGATNATYTLVTADEDKAIKVRVSFTDDAGNEEALTSEPTDAVLAALPPPPDNVRAVPQKSGAVELTWDAPPGATVTGYRIDRRRAEGDSSDPQRSIGSPRDNHTLVEDTGSADTGYTDKSAEKGVEYEYRVSSRNESGPGEGSDWVRAGPEPVWGDGLPGAPRNLTATAGNKEVTLSWDPPDDNGNPPTTRYRIEWRIDGKDYKKGHWGPSGKTTYTKTDLANGVKYVFRVKAENGNGNSYGPYGPASEEVSATPTSGSAVDLGTPVLSDTETLHHGMVQLDWEDIEDAGWYVVQYYHVKSGEWLDLPAAGVDIAFHGSSAVVSNLHGLSWLRVRAMSCAGESEWSQIEELYGTKASDWEDVPVPEVAEGDEIEPCPVILGTPVLSNTKTLHHGMVQLDWEDIEDAGWYVVQYYHVKSGEWLDLPAGGVDVAFHGSSAVVSNLHGLSWLRVRAMSCAGESEWSQIEELYGTKASDWEDVPVPEVAEGDEIEPCSEDVDTSDNSPATGAPTVSGTAQVGETLTANTSGIADADGLGNVQYEYQWLADDAEIAGATSLTYALSAADEGKAIKVEVSFTDDAGNEETLSSAATAAVAAAPTPNSPATGAPTISGTAQVGETLTANTSEVADADGLSNVRYEYQWLADDAEIAGATSLTYTLAETDEGKAIKVEVTFTDDLGNEETLTSAATDAVAAAPTPNSHATGAPTITGTAQVGETLTANTSGIADADGLGSVRYEYQWLADDSEIGGASSLTYTLADTEEGKAIKVQVSFTDDAGNEETLTSEATDAVAAAEPSEPPDKPRGLEATSTHDSVTLTWNDPEDDSITGYVILRRVRVNDQGGDFSVLVADTGSAATTYTDTTVAASTTYTYRIKAINEHGTSERSRWVHIDTPAPPVPDKPTGLEATASNSQVVLTWDDPDDDSITGYVILRRLPGVDPEGQFDELVANTGSAATTYTDDSVAPETRYTYRIKAINEHGTSERSRWFHIDTPAAP